MESLFNNKSDVFSLAASIIRMINMESESSIIGINTEEKGRKIVMNIVDKIAHS